MFTSTCVFLLYLLRSLTVVNGQCQTSPSVTTVKGSLAPTGQICSGDLIFDDEFDTFDLSVWRHDITAGGGSSNNQFQLYINNRSNTYADEGVLHIAPTLLANQVNTAFLSSGTIDLNSWFPHLVCTNFKYNGCTRTGNSTVILNPVNLARISTANSFAFKYGTLEIRAKIPTGDWLWPALWIMPRFSQYGNWPASGEIDIMESRGNTQLTKNGVNIGTQQISSTLHWGPNSNNNKYTITDYATQNPSGWNNGFHSYQLEWTPDNITFLIDNTITGSYTPPVGGFWQAGNFNSAFANPWSGGSIMAPFDKEFFIIMNVACGSTSFFSDTAVNSPYSKPWKNTDGPVAMTKFWNASSSWLPTWNLTTDNSHMQIDYVRVWAL